MRRILLAIAAATLVATATVPFAATADHDRTVIEAFDASAAFGDDAELQAQLLEDEDEPECPCPERFAQVDFLIDGEYVGTDLTDEGGYADLKVDLEQDRHPGEHTITVRHDTEHDVAVTDTATLTVTEETTELEAHDGYLEARLTDDEDNPVPGQPVTFTVLLPQGQEAEACTAYTNADGLARCLPWTGIGIQDDNLRYRADFAGDEDFEASSDTAALV